MISHFATMCLLIATALPAVAPASAQAPSLDSWVEDDRTGCRIRNPEPQPRESVAWSGACPNGIAEGTGILQWFDDGRPSDRYEGELRDGWENGRGIASSTIIADRYDGDWRDGWRHGRGVYSFANGDRYEGDWFEGLRTGRGTMTWADGARYEGEWLDNKPDGQGTYTAADGAVFSGAWSGGCFSNGTRKMAAATTAGECGF